jgi:hypothetical protein
MMTMIQNLLLPSQAGHFPHPPRVMSLVPLLLQVAKKRHL